NVLPFVARALDDASHSIKVGLHLSAPRLFEKGEPLANLCGQVVDRLNAVDSSSRTQGGLPNGEWWERLTQEMAAASFVLALRELHELKDEQLGVLATLLAQFVQRKGARLMLVSNQPYDKAVWAELDRYLAPPVLVLPLIWEEVWLW